MSDERFSLDANVLFYAIDANDHERHSRAMGVMDRAAVEFDCIITLQAFFRNPFTTADPFEERPNR